MGSTVAISYVLAMTSNTANARGFEVLSFTNPTLMTFAFMPVTVAGRTIYAPVRTLV